VITRRRFIGWSALVALGSTSGCGLARFIGDFGSHVAMPGDSIRTPEERLVLRVLDRFGYGPRPGDVARVAALGVDAYIEQQLAFDSIDDTSSWWRVRRVETLSLAAEDLFAVTDAEAVSDLRCGTLVRAVYSDCQLFERMVEFWSDHFNIYGEKEGCGRLLVVHDREVIRRHALGQFNELLRAVLTSPAMLVYLDGATSTSGNPNENHARELLELHTLGVEAGYSQTDVREAARAMTGWRVRPHWRPGSSVFEPRFHDDGEKTVLATPYEKGLGSSDVERLVASLCANPTTIERLAAKLCRRFVAPDPSRELVKRVANRLAASGLNIRDALREIARSPEFAAAPPMIKRPYSFAISSLRALDAATDGGRGLQDAIRKLGQLPFSWPTPDGFPDDAKDWEAMLPSRWAFAHDLASGRIAGTRPDERFVDDAQLAATALVHRILEPFEVDAIGSQSSGTGSLSLLLSMPAFNFQ
jgi:uncharacterized protein (DUF1800 family)